MRGDIDNTQPVSLDGSPMVKARVIYSVWRMPEQRMQFGSVRVDYGIVAVWRPYDPENAGPEAAWRSLPWRNIYRVLIPQTPLSDRPGYVAYELGQVEIGDLQSILPIARLDLAYQLREYLKAL